MEQHVSGVYAKSIQSGKWFMASVFCQKFLNLATFFILARLLAPVDYGVMTAALLVVGLLNQLTDFTFGDALTQRKGSIEPYLDPLWTFDVIRSLGIGLILYFASPFIVDFFHISPTFLPLIRVSGILAVLPSFSNIRQIYFFKELQFRKVFVRDVLAQFAFSLGAISVAIFVSATAWALFAGYMAQYVVGLAMSYILHPSRPAFSAQFHRLKDLLGYSKWVYGQNFLDLLFTQVDKLFVGRLLSSTELGVYSKAKDMASIATATLGSMINKVGFAAFSKVQDRLEKVQEGFLKSLDVLLVISLPVALLLLLEGGAVVMIFLGTKWLALVVPLKIFAFGNLFLAFVRIVSPVLGALGRPDINFRLNSFQAVLSVPLLYFGYRLWGANGMAFGVVIAWIAFLAYAVLQARLILRIPKRAFFPAFLCGGVACAGVLVVDVLIRSLTPGGSIALLWLFARVSVLGILYFFLLFGMSRKLGNGPWYTVRSILKELKVLPSGA